MIELFSADTPNGKKISIMLEEIGYDYKVTSVDLHDKKEQFNIEFRKISPFSKIPVIVDHNNNKEAIFESGAILMYLGERSNKFYDKENRLKINQWLMVQMGYVGPMIGQHHQFHHYHQGKSEFGEKRYFDITRRIYQDLDERLGQSKYLAGEKYTIADIATWPWIARFERHRIDLKKYPNVFRWYKLIAERPAVIKGYNVIGKFEKIPLT